MIDTENNKKHVLVVSGDPLNLAEIKAELMPYFNVSMSAASSAALNALGVYSIAAVVICIGENSSVAFSDFHDIFETAKRKHVPILFIADNGNDDDETKAFEVGAVDYSTRRRGTVDALVNRIRLRISAGEHEKILMTGDNFEPPNHEITPEKSLAGKTFLLVDDVMINRELIKAMLSDIEGLTVAEAANGAEAVNMFNNSPDVYSLILMDIQMPEMDGLEATRIIRTAGGDHGKKIPIIALTAASLESEVKMCIEAGMNDFIAKPMSYDDLIVMVVEHCNN